MADRFAVAREKLIEAFDALEAAERRHALAAAAEEEIHRRMNDFTLSADERRRAWREGDAINDELDAAEEALERAQSEFSRAGFRLGMLSIVNSAKETRR